MTKRSTAPGWEKWDGVYRTQWRPVIDQLCRAARLASGMTVLDIATGTGQPAIPASERVRPGGRVIGIDTDTEMLAACRRLARHAGADNLELREMDMHALGFGDGMFDAVTFGFALQFARDPVRVLTEVRRVLRPGGWFALAVWDEAPKNPLFTTAFEALASVVPQPPPDPKAPGPFRLAAKGELPSVLRAAGFTDFQVEAVPFTLESASPDTHWEMMSEMAPVLVNALAEQPAEVVAKVKDALLAKLSPFVVDGKPRLPVSALIASAARRPE
jgi:SAM-dependent methyltransferase